VTEEDKAEYLGAHAMDRVVDLWGPSACKYIAVGEGNLALHVEHQSHGVSGYLLSAVTRAVRHKYAVFGKTAHVDMINTDRHACYQANSRIYAVLYSFSAYGATLINNSVTACKLLRRRRNIGLMRSCHELDFVGDSALREDLIGFAYVSIEGIP
jgi:GNAT superfamily N-acetyltransferase